MSKEKDRLPSFKGPRDLTLTTAKGSTASSTPRTKRVFTPNIPPKRDRGSSNAGPSSRQSPSEPSTSSSSSFQARPSAPRINTWQNPAPPRGGGRGRGKRDFIQSASVFAEGVGDPLAVRKSSVPSLRNDRAGGGGGGRGGRGGGGRGGGSGGKATPNVTKASLDDLIKVEQEEEETDKKVFGGDVYDTTVEEKDDPNVPVILPLTTYVPEFYIDPLPVPEQGIPKELELIAGVRIKTERQGESVIPMPEIPPIDPTSFPHVLAAAPSEGTLFLFQLPDQLPVLEQIVESGDSSKTSGSRTERQSSNNPANAKGQTKPESSKLAKDIRTLPEGKIGKIQILASGKARFVLGENIFEIESGKPVGFRQDLVSINLEDEKLIGLGPVAHKFVCTPDIDALLREIL